MPPLHINARFLTQPLSGTQRYAEQILDALDARLPDWTGAPRLIAWAPPGERRDPRWRNIELRVTGRSSGHMWEQTELALAARGGWLLSLISSGPILHPRQIVTLHDAALSDHPDHFSRKYALVHGIVRPLIARRARRIVTVSEFSRLALSRALKVPADKFAVVPNGSDHLLRFESDSGMLARRGLDRHGYVLFVGNEAPHKNVRTALAAFAGLKHPTLQFVTVGIGLSGVFGDYDHSGGRPIRRLRDVGDAELRALYENAALLIFPSRYEGFGIPPVEAMSLGCPVVASDASAIPEVVGDAAVLCDPDDVEGMRDAMLRIAEDGALRSELVHKGHERAALFTWAEAARKLEAVLSEVLARKAA